MFPDNQIAALPISYDKTLYRFCCSVSWRVLTYLKLSGSDPHIKESSISRFLEHRIPVEDHALCDLVRDAWGQSILSGTTSSTDQHMLFLNGKNVPLERSDIVGFSIFQQGRDLATISILGPVLVIGFIRQGTGWSGTKVDPFGSTFTVKKQSIPVSFGRWLHDLYFGIARVSP